MTIIESVYKAVDETLEAGILKGKVIYLISDFPVQPYRNGYSTHAGKVFRKYIKSQGYLMVTANTVNIKDLDSHKIRGNKVVIIHKADFEKYKNIEVINDKLVKRALLQALTIDDEKNIQGVINAKVDYFLLSLKSETFHRDMQQSLYRTTGRLPQVDRVALVINNYVDTLLQ